METCVAGVGTSYKLNMIFHWPPAAYQIQRRWNLFLPAVVGGASLFARA